MREAANQQEILHLLRQEARLDVRVISGHEEARLIYLGVSRGIHLGNRLRLFLSISGAEAQKLRLGVNRTTSILKVSDLGAIRLSNLYMSGTITAPVSHNQYKKVQQHIKDAIIHSVRKIQEQKPDLAVGSSGTVINLFEIAQKSPSPEREFRRIGPDIQRFAESY